MAQTVQKSVPEKAREKAGEAARDASDKLRSEAKSARDAAARETRKAADAAQAAAEELDSGAIQAQAIEQVASRIDDLAAQIRGSNIDRMARVVGDTAQRNPLLFVAGAALAGFAATRFLTARDPARHANTDYGDAWDPFGGSPTPTQQDTRPVRSSRGAVKQ